jgi:ferredoxin
MPKKVPEGAIKLKPDCCDFCGTCVAVCPVDCIELAEYRLTIDDSVCTRCMNCVYSCPVGALVFRSAGELETAEDKV